MLECWNLANAAQMVPSTPTRRNSWMLGPASECIMYENDWSKIYFSFQVPEVEAYSSELLVSFQARTAKSTNNIFFAKEQTTQISNTVQKKAAYKNPRESQPETFLEIWVLSGFRGCLGS